MEQKKIDRIKAAVKAHFDQSPEHYQLFEDEHGFFQLLNGRLLREMNPLAGAHILDVGCGTGASCKQILDTIPDSRVWGLDISPAMLEEARSRMGESDRLILVEGDAAALSRYFDLPFDAIVYSASIFLVPDFPESLRQARTLLKPNGVVGLTFMDGLYNPDGKQLFAEADRVGKEGVSLKKPVNLDEFRTFFGETFPRHRFVEEEFRLPWDLLRAFFSIPAMSAGLFPGIDYPERVRKIARLFDLMPETEPIFRWTLMVGQGAE